MEHKIRVLLADDQSILADGIKSVLSSCEDIEVVGIASDGFEALDLLEKCAPDVILMDIRMPVMSGYEATRKIRETDRPDAAEVPIIAMTPDALAEDIQRCRNSGMNAHIAKPLDMRELLGVLQKYVG